MGTALLGHTAVRGSFPHRQWLFSRFDGQSSGCRKGHVARGAENVYGLALGRAAR